ncbi:MAG TPA: hypothetical protein VGI93_24575 [Steroidobacteraceae bacterium]|jgi:hypothetical protein
MMSARDPRGVRIRVLGLKVRSGFATGVIVDGQRDSWKIDRRLQVPLTAGDEHYARFPFHPLVDIAGGAGEEQSRRFVERIEAAAGRSLDSLLPNLAPLHHAVIVAGSLTDPERVGNPHMRVHAREGQLFRRVVADGLARQGISCACVSEKNVEELCAVALGVEVAHLRAMLTGAGRGLIKPWRREEKLALSAALWKLPS